MGVEVFINYFLVGVGVFFVYLYKQNEEIYGIFLGKGFIIIDGEKIELQVGDWFCIVLDGKCQIFVVFDSFIGFFCIQVKVGFLEGYIMIDGVV